jgi:transcriptional regulator with XRE-family HTH domain
LCEARTEAGISQRQLGALVGLDLSVASVRMNQYERGVHEPHYGFVERLAKALSLPAAYFYAEDPLLAKVIARYGRLSVSDRKKLLASLRTA